MFASTFEACLRNDHSVTMSVHVMDAVVVACVHCFGKQFSPSVISQVSSASLTQIESHEIPPRAELILLSLSRSDDDES